jgi:hypothetical protein
MEPAIAGAARRRGTAIAAEILEKTAMAKENI